MRAYATIEDALTMGNGVERTFHCGNPDHNDRNASASVNSITGAFICYSCGWCGRIDVDSYEIDQSMATRELAKIVMVLESDDRPLTESWLSQYDAAGPGEYWLSRFTPEACRKFRLGMDYAANAATIPIRSLNGVPLGVARRFLDPEAESKYKYPRDHDMRNYLFAYDMCDDEIIILTEGATDAIAAWEVGHQAMAIYGSHMSKNQRDAIIRYWPKGIVMAFDQDRAGHMVAADVANRFPEFATFRPTWDSSVKDLASMSLGHRKAILDEAKKNILLTLAQTRSSVLEFETCESRSSQTKSGSTEPSAPTAMQSGRPRKLRIARTSPKQN